MPKACPFLFIQAVPDAQFPITTKLRSLGDLLITSRVTVFPAFFKIASKSSEYKLLDLL